MTQYDLEGWVDIITSLDERGISSTTPLPRALRIEAEGPLEVYYAPFDYVHRDARLAIVGITPGRTQAVEALLTARRALREGHPHEEALRRAKRRASFCGTMRTNLVELIDFVGLTTWLGLQSADQLFELSSDVTHTTSAFRNPVFYRGANYNNQTKLARSALLQRTARRLLGDELAALPGAVVVPLGDAAKEAVLYAMRERGLDTSRVLTDMVHPSRANNERIAYLVGRKARSALSVKTNAEKLDRARASLLRTVAALPR